MITVDKLKKSFYLGNNEVKAVDDISYSFEVGKFYAIVGRSGGGKSTFLSLVGLLQNPDSGEIRIDGENVNSASVREKARIRNKVVGFVFQDFCLEPEYTCGENVVLPLIPAKVKGTARKEAVERALASVGLSDRMHQKVKTLSGGEQQRIAIARALINDPGIILADEPTGNLDSENGKKIMEILKKISESGKTVIMVTHNQEDAKNADVILTYSDGKIIEEVAVC